MDSIFPPDSNKDELQLMSQALYFQGKSSAKVPCVLLQSSMTIH